MVESRFVPKGLRTSLDRDTGGRGGPRARLSSDRFPLRLFIVLILGATLALPAYAGRTSRCRHDDFQVVGVVKDATGRPLREARVYVLLDRISEKKFREQGMRARIVGTDASGRFSAHVVCGEDPDPCARKPKNLTVAAEASGHSTRLRVFKLVDLRVSETPFGCTIEAPEIRLSFSD